MDVRVTDHGSLVLVEGISPAGEAWIEEYVGGAETLYWGDAVVCEPRYVPPIIQAMLAEGLVVH